MPTQLHAIGVIHTPYEKRPLRKGGRHVESGDLVEVSGLEPLTFWLPARRSPS